MVGRRSKRGVKGHVSDHAVGGQCPQALCQFIDEENGAAMWATSKSGNHLDNAFSFHERFPFAIPNRPIRPVNGVHHRLPCGAPLLLLQIPPHRCHKAADLSDHGGASVLHILSRRLDCGKLQILREPE